jgi:type II secretory pathway pseudopilin PulG
MSVNKKGITLVETVSAVAILALLAASVLSSVVFARTQLTAMSERNTAAASAQGIMDVLIGSLSAGETRIGVLEARSLADFDSDGVFEYTADSPHQFTFATQMYRDNALYKITVVSFYDNGRQRVTLTGSAVNTGTLFTS